MASYSFSQGVHIEFRGREFVVEENLPNGDLRVLDIAFDESHSEKKEDLVKALFAGELEFLGDSATTQAQREQARRFVEDFTMLDEENPRKIEAKRRLAYVKAVVDAKLDTYTKETVEPILQTVHQEINDKKNEA